MILYAEPHWVLLLEGSIYLMAAVVLSYKYLLPCIRYRVKTIWSALMALMVLGALFLATCELLPFFQYRYAQKAAYVLVNEQGVTINKLGLWNDHGYLPWSEIVTVSNSPFNKTLRRYIRITTTAGWFSGTYDIDCYYLGLRTKEVLAIIEAAREKAASVQPAAPHQ
jgi:hypothetical protein